MENHAETRQRHHQRRSATFGRRAKTAAVDSRPPRGPARGTPRGQDRASRAARSRGFSGRARQRGRRDLAADDSRSPRRSRPAFRCRLVAPRAPARKTLRTRAQCDRRLPQPSRRQRRGRDWRGRKRSCPSSAVPQSPGQAASLACDRVRTQARHPHAASSVRATRNSPSCRTASAIVFTQWIWTTTGDGMIACTLVSIEGRRPLAFSCASTKSTAAAARGSPSAIALRRGSRRTGVMIS